MLVPRSNDQPIDDNIFGFLEYDGTATGVTAAPQDKSEDAVAAVDIGSCYQTFKARLLDASKAGSDRRKSLIDAFHASCPAHPDAWIYNTKVLDHLAEIEWDPAPILSGRHMQSFAVPPIHALESAQMLDITGRILALFPHRVHYVHTLCVRMVEAALEAAEPLSTLRSNTLHGLVRLLWSTARLSRGNVKEPARQLLCAIANQAWGPVVDTLLRTICSDATKAEHHIRRLVEQASMSSASFTAAEHVLGCIPGSRLSAWVPSITSTFARAVSKTSLSLNYASIQQMEHWLQLLQRVDIESGGHERSLLDNAIDSIARHTLARPKPCHFQARIILTALILKIFQPDNHEDVKALRMLQIVQSSTSSTLDDKVSFVDTVGSFLSRMRTAHLPYQPLAEAMLDTFAIHANPALVLQLSTVLEARRLTVSDTQVLREVIAGHISQLRVAGDRLAAIQQDHNAFVMRTCERILQVLHRIRATTTTPTTNVDALSVLDELQSQRQFQHILGRAADCHALPLAYRNVSADVPAEQRVNLIHQIAHQHSTDNTRTCREAGRAMYYLYRYLRQNSLPIGPLFTKAVVRVYIVRPLSENRFVSARRLIWVCHLVADVEGEDVAKKIESAFWDWRGDLIKHSKDVYVAVGGDRHVKAHIGTMKRLGLI